MAQAFERLRHRPSGGRSKAWAWPRLLISVVAGARNHLQANRSLGFCFEILISNLCWERRRTAGSRPHPVPLSVVNTRPLRPRLPPSASPSPRRSLAILRSWPPQGPMPQDDLLFLAKRCAIKHLISNNILK